MILDGKVDSSDRWMVGGHWTTGRDEGGDAGRAEFATQGRAISTVDMDGCWKRSCRGRPSRTKAGG